MSDARRGKTHYAAECVTCSWTDARWEPGRKVPAAAKRHAQKHPGHEVLVTGEFTTYYREARDDS